MFGVKFHSYLYGRPFTLITDHKPLLTLFNESRVVPPQASGRIQRWALTLAAYEYTLSWRPTQQHENADAMSCLPLPEKPLETPLPAELVLLMEHLEESPVTATQIRMWTRRDPFGRIQHWALTLAAYEYTLLWRLTQQHENADAMSRLPLPEKPLETLLPAELVLLMQHLEESPVTATQIRMWTRRDPLLSQVSCYLHE